MKSLMWAISSLVVVAGSLQASAQNARNVREYNRQNGVGLKGYDPVSYFREGGGEPAQGQSRISLNHRGVNYYFATSANREQFQRDPEKYEPTYGGWCAYAMASGSKVDIKPDIYTLNGRRIHFFVSKRAKRSFDADVADYERNADSHWSRISGESARK